MCNRYRYGLWLLFPDTRTPLLLHCSTPQRFTRSVRVVKAGFGTDVDSIGSVGAQMVVANPENACGALANAGAALGSCTQSASESGRLVFNPFRFPLPWLLASGSVLFNSLCSTRLLSF